MPEQPSEESLSATELIYLEYQERKGRGENVHLEDVCADHPEHAEVLRRIDANWLEIDQFDVGLESVSVDRPHRDPVAWLSFLRDLELERTGEVPRYRSEDEIGRGGMGAVIRVFDRGLRRHLAMKVIRDPTREELAPVRAVDSRSLGRFVEEAQITAQLDHPGIIPVHELGLDERGRIFFTMKLVRGEDLGATFRKVQAGVDGWNVTRALGALLRACEALAFAHQKGVVHRDLKPANIMVGDFGAVYVMDWGLARVLGEELEPAPSDAERSDRIQSVRRELEASPTTPLVTLRGEFVGTPAYVAPEQALGQLDVLDARADVYSMGAILYELLSGRKPIANPPPQITSVTELARYLAETPPPPLGSVCASAHAELVAIVERAMARNADDRYPDMTALASDLSSYLEHRVVAAYETGAWAELKKWMQRNAVLAMTVAVAALLLAVLGTWSYVEIRDERNTAVAREREVRRLSDKRRLDALVEEAETLWPAHPGKLEAMKSWLDRANALLVRLPEHEKALAEARARGTPVPFEPGRTTPGDEVSPARDYVFGGDDELRWWHDAVRDLVIGLHAMMIDDVYRPTISSIRWRIGFAETVADRTTTGPEVASRWKDARRAVRAHPSYRGLDLAPQIGLVPLGPDPDSKLWEFAHVRTGDVPVRDPDTGRLEITGESSVVLVLVPKGSYRIGAQAIDPAAPHYDRLAEDDESPVHEVALSAYFLSKYELTQGQWARATGRNPSWWASTYPDLASGAHPIDNVAWESCERTLLRLGLYLPTEAQWEAACRAETDTPWFFGEDDSDSGSFQNVRDVTYANTMNRTDPASCDEFDDGHAPPALIGTYRPNPFGFHEMHGNTWEWCRDAYSPTAYVDVSPEDSDGFRAADSPTLRVVRGGGFNGRSAFSRTAGRLRMTKETRINDLGTRPAKTIEP